MPNAGLQEKTQLVKSEKSINKIGLAYTNFIEQTFFNSYYNPATLKRPYNPDAVYSKTGDYSIYEEMLNDDQVSVCLQLIKDLVLGGGWSLIPESDDGKEEADEMEYMLNEDYEGNFDESLEEVISAYEYGVSISEKVFKRNENGKVVLKYLKTRHPDTFLIHVNSKGNVERLVQRAQERDVDVRPEDVIHYVNRPKFQNPYGHSDLRAAYNAWFTKRQVIKYYGIFLEKGASPIPIGRYESNVSKEVVDELYEALKTFQTKTTLVIPKDLIVDFLESKSNGEAYQKAIDLFNMFIGRSLFVPDLIGLHGAQSSGGSLALGKEQIGVFFKHIERRKESLEVKINSEIVRPMYISNYGLDKKPPYFKLRPVSESEAMELAKIWLEAVKGKVWKVTEEEVNYFRKACRFPEGEVELQDPVPQTIPWQINEQVGRSERSKNGTDDESEREELPKVYALPPGNYHKKVDFKAIKISLKAYDNSAIDQLQLITKKILNDLYDQIERKNILRSQDVSKFNSVNLKYMKEMKTVLKSGFRDLYKDSSIQAARELNRSDFAVKRPLTSEKFNQTIEQETFSYIGDWANNIKRIVRIQLTAAIKDGRPLSSILNSLDHELEEYSNSSIERFIRTKHTEVMNRARVDYFDSTGVVTAYQYSAILDDVVTDLCASLDGKVFESGNEPVPPLHFNCRSTLVPITKYEDYRADTRAGGKPIDEYIQDNIGEGFSVK